MAERYHDYNLLYYQSTMQVGHLFADLRGRIEDPIAINNEDVS